MKVADMHCDTIGAIYENKLLGNNFNLNDNNFHIDIKKMKDGDYILQNFAMFIDIKKYKNPYETLKEMIKVYYDEIDKNGEYIHPVYNYEDILKCEKENKIAALLTIEDSGALEGKIERLKEVYDKGVRLITLTWNYPNGVGYPNINLKVDSDGKVLEKPDLQAVNTNNGLTKFGIELVEEMESLGIIVDVSHSSDASFYDVLKYTKKPFVASHSNARAISNVARNLSDDMIRELANRGGLTGINFCSNFVKPTPYKEPTFTYINDLVEHIKHIKNIGGINSIALGSDFDGIPSTLEINNCSKMQLLSDSLLKNGFTYEEVEKIFFKNLFNLYKELL